VIARLRQEDGMTLMEVLIAATIGFVVLAATLGLLESSLRLNGGVASRTDAMQRGRLAMDRITQELRSQVCLDLDHPAVLQNGTSNSVQFYADFSEADGTKPPERRTLTFDAAKRSITTLIYTTAVVAPTPDSYPPKPTSADLDLDNVSLQKDDKGVTIPFLTYYAYQSVGAPAHPEPTQLLATPLDAASAARVARIDINFVARPIGATDDKNAVNVSDQIIARHADPNLSVPDPACV
jgi:hypothetical protein